MARLVGQDSQQPSPATPPSPLYCRYHGFLLGQFLSLAFSDSGTIGYAERRGRLRVALRELGVDVPIPESPAARGGLTHAGVLAAVLPPLARQSRELAEFTILGGLLAHYAIAAGTDVAPAAALLLEIERLRAAYDLPAIDLVRFATAAGECDADGLLSPALDYLGKIIARLPIEPDTAVVILPIARPYTEHYAGFHRPVLEHCGYRALCAWGGLGGEASTELVLALVGKAGFVWADVSEIDRGNVVAIGAAQALGLRTMIVAAEERSASFPARIGRDAVIRYDPRSADWPHGPVLLMSACLAGITLAEERGDQLRIGPNAIEGAFDEVSQALGPILLPPGAREAQRRGRRAMDAGDLAVAEASFDDACRLGLHDAETLLWRGWARLGLGRFDEAAADLDAVLGADPLVPPIGEWRPIAAYLRAVLRESRGDLAGAMHDFELAVSLGLSDVERRDMRAGAGGSRQRVDPPSTTRDAVGTAAAPQ